MSLLFKAWFHSSLASWRRKARRQNGHEQSPAPVTPAMPSNKPQPPPQAPQAHRALFLDDIVQLVLDWSCNGRLADLYHLALVCTFWSEPALDRLWGQDEDALRDLMLLMPYFGTKRYSLATRDLDSSSPFPIKDFTPNELAIVRRYLPRVKVTAHGLRNWELAFLFSLSKHGISIQHRDVTITPRSFAYSSLVLPPSLVSVAIRGELNSQPWSLALAHLQRTPLPLLTILKIESDENVEPSVADTLLDILELFVGQLTTIQVPKLPTSRRRRLLGHLHDATNLQTLVVHRSWDDASELDTTVSLPPNTDSCPLSNLRQIRWDDDLEPFFYIASLIPNQTLRTVAFHKRETRDHEVHAEALGRVVRLHTASLRSFCYNEAHSRCHSDTIPHGSDDCLTNMLEPLFGCTNLESLCIGGYAPAYIKPDHIEGIAASFPDLRELRLAPCLRNLPTVLGLADLRPLIRLPVLQSLFVAVTSNEERTSMEERRSHSLDISKCPLRGTGVSGSIGSGKSNLDSIRRRLRALFPGEFA